MYKVLGFTITKKKELYLTYCSIGLIVLALLFNMVNFKILTTLFLIFALFLLIIANWENWLYGPPALGSG